MRFIGQKDAFMPLHYFKELSPDEHNNLDVIVNSYSHNFRIKFVRLVAIEILNADVNAKNSSEFVRWGFPVNSRQCEEERWRRLRQ